MDFFTYMLCMKYEIWKKQHKSGTQNLFLKETQNGIHGFLSC